MVANSLSVNKYCHRAEVSGCLDLKQNVEAAHLAKVITSITQLYFANLKNLEE